MIKRIEDALYDEVINNQIYAYSFRKKNWYVLADLAIGYPKREYKGFVYISLKTGRSCIDKYKCRKSAIEDWERHSDFIIVVSDNLAEVLSFEVEK